MVDALRSGRSSRKGLEVQILSAAQKEMQNYKEYFKGKKGVIMGLGILGGAVNDAVFLAECGAELVVTDLKSAEELKISINKLKKFNKPAAGRAGIKYVLGHHDIEDFKQADFILQPGNVPADSPYLIEARKNNIPIHESESLFMEYAKDVKVIGITGTRGKTTTTYLIYDILKSAYGRRVHIGGNVQGNSTLALLKKIKPGDMVVLELDSWCLNGMGAVKKSPQISVFTNLMPDHLNFYLKGLSTKLGVKQQEAEAMQKYFMDKAQIFAHQTKNDYLILDQDIKKIIGERYKAKIKSQIILINKDKPEEVGKWKIKVKGEHNFKHILRAVEVAKIMGVDMKIIKKAVENFGGVEGRQEFICEYKGIKIYNDTTATTPEGVMVALKSLGDIKKKNLVLIMGGADKGIDISGLMKEIPKYCKAVVFLSGSGTKRLKKEFSAEVNDWPEFDNLKEAVKEAVSLCQKGDTLILSPGFASFGMFTNEYDRGDKFKAIIKGLPQ